MSSPLFKWNNKLIIPIGWAKIYAILGDMDHSAKGIKINIFGYIKF
jgi:hypothetical protein